MCIEKYTQYVSLINKYKIEIGYYDKITIKEFIELKKNIKSTLLPLFNEIVLEALGIKKLPSFNFDNVVSGITYGLNNYHKKVTNENYYIQNILAFNYTITKILEKTDALDFYEDKNPENFLNSACVEEHRSILRTMFFSSCLLIQDIFSYRNITCTHPNCGSSTHNPIFMMGRELTDILYGHHLPYSQIELRIYPAIPTIRIMIEVKMRSAFGIIGLKNKINNTIDPLPLSKIFTVIDNYILSKDVIFNVNFDNIKKIYSWTNIYIHSGFKGYIWYSYIFNEYLSPLFYATNVKLPNGGWDIRAGIKIKKEALKKIQDDIRQPIELECFDDENALNSVLFE